MSPVLASGLAFLVFGIGGSILYLFFCNRSTGQSLHDLAFGTVVVSAGASAPTKQPSLAAVHRLVMACIGVLAIVGMIAESTIQKGLGDRLALPQALWTILSADPRFFNVSVNQTFSLGAHTTTTVSIQAWLKDPSANRKLLAPELATKALDQYKSAEPDNLTIVLTRAYDLGVASWQSNDVDSGPTAEWKQRTSTPDMRSRPATAGRGR